MIQHVIDTFMLPKTKILEGGTRDEIRIFEALFQWIIAQFKIFVWEP